MDSHLRSANPYVAPISLLKQDNVLHRTVGYAGGYGSLLQQPYSNSTYGYASRLQYIHSHENMLVHPFKIIKNKCLGILSSYTINSFTCFPHIFCFVSLQRRENLLQKQTELSHEKHMRDSRIAEIRQKNTDILLVRVNLK